MARHAGEERRSTGLKTNVMEQKRIRKQEEEVGSHVDTSIGWDG
jgi:hypothetical protein